MGITVCDKGLTRLDTIGSPIEEQNEQVPPGYKVHFEEFVGGNFIYQYIDEKLHKRIPIHEYFSSTLESTQLKWEYISDLGLNNDPHREETLLNNYGNDGWELIAMILLEGGKYLRYYFKRPKVEK